MKNRRLKIVVVGSSGMLGHDVVRLIEKDHTVITPTRDDFDLTDWNSVERFFYKVQSADLIINCAAYTKVDDCETNSSKAFAINGHGPQILAKCAERVKAEIMHVSTDYVFDGTKNQYTVDDKTNAQSIYGKSKALGEYYVQTISSRHMIVRTSWLYGSHGSNFVKTILKAAKNENPLRVVNDQFGCPTYTVDLAQAMVSLIDSEKYGIHHASGEGHCSWFIFAKRILKEANIEKEVLPISTKKSFVLFPHIKAPRPARSILVNTLNMRPWQDSLASYLRHENTLDQR